MTHKIAGLTVLLAAALGSGNLAADSIVDGSVDAGKARSATCAACHGPDGNSVNPAWPNIAGQNAVYLVRQLNAFRDGERSDPLMSSQAALLSDEDIANLAVFYESQAPAAQPVPDPSLIDRAEALYRGGDVKSSTAACIACHGPTGRGNPAAGYPALNGQHQTYTAKQLQDYASGARTSDGKTRMMQDVAATLDAKDIEALAAYVQGLR